MKHYIFSVIRDPEPLNPRKDYPTFGTMACWHRRYCLGDEQPQETPEEYLRGISDAIVLPLYLYDHSGITISTAPFSCQWDSSQVGFVSVSKARVRDEFGVKRITAKVRERVEKILQDEVRDYDQYLQGEVWMFEIKEVPEDRIEEELSYCDHPDELDLQESFEQESFEGWEEFHTYDSCGGFYDEEECRRQARIALAEAEAGYAQRIARQHGQLELTI